MKAKSITTWLVLLVFVAAGVACQFTSKATPSAGNPPAGKDPEATKVGAVESTQASNPQAPAEQPAGGPGAFTLEDFSVGIDALNSFRQSLVLTFDGTVAGTETHSKTTVRRTVIRQPAAQLTWMEIDGNPQELYATVGDVTYRQTGADGTCSAHPTEPQIEGAPAIFQLQSLPVVIGATAAGEESVNEVPATHYTFDESAIGRAGEVKAKGDLWIAKEGGYVVKYTLSIEGDNDQLGPGVAGTQTWTYDLTSPNAVSEPDLPVNCAVQQVDDIAPLPPDAVDILRMPNFLQFSVAQTPEQVAQFYRDQAASLTWEEEPVTPMENADLIVHFKTAAGGLVSVRLQAVEGGTRVTVQTLPGRQ